jgi:hypothetical protein
VIQRREALQQTYLDLLLELARLHETRGEYQSAISAYQRLLAVDPLLEEVYAGLMRSFALSGQRTQALRQYQVLKDTLKKELQVEPEPATTQLYESIRGGKIAGAIQTKSYPLPSPHPNPSFHSGQAPLPWGEGKQPTSTAHPNNLPYQMTSFIGRENEIAEVAALFGKNRLVTLTGSGGTGKTRLALQVAASVLATFQDGAWLVELAPLGDPERVVLTAAQVFGLREVSGVPLENVLSGYLRDKRLLLILDNCEHVLSECSRLADLLLKKCPQLTLLATSREILGVASEMPFRVPPLAAPDLKHLPDLGRERSRLPLALS